MLWVILVAGVGSKLMTLSLHSLLAPWKLVFPSSVEVLTILALLTWARNRTGFWQVGLLSIAWFAHLFCYVDIITGSNLVYDNYSSILGLVAVGQILVCYDTLLHIWFSLGRAVLHWHRSRSVRLASVPSAILHSKGDSGI